MLDSSKCVTILETVVRKNNKGLTYRNMGNNSHKRSLRQGYNLNNNILNLNYGNRLYAIMAESLNFDTTTNERRSSQRVDASIRVYLPGKSIKRYMSANASANGLFLHCRSREFRLNQVFNLVIALEKNGVTRIFWRIAKVVRIHTDGYGLRIWRDRNSRN